MKVQFSLVGHDTSKDSGIIRQIVVDLPAVPQVGDIIKWPGLSEAGTYVRTIVWYISCDDDDEKINESFVYVVVGPERR